MVDEKALTVDALAQEIRRVDGNHSLGAGALAEALMPFITGALSPGSTGEAEGWHDIESAPKERVGMDRQVIQLWDGKRVRQGYWDDNRFANKPRPFWAYEGSFRTTDDRENQPTHWRPLPAPPSAMLSAGCRRAVVSEDGRGVEAPSVTSAAGER